MNIAVLLSGGVDSSVAVHLLSEQGYRPSLFYIRISSDGTWYVEADTPIQGIAPGQFGVIYDWEHRLCLGSGEIGY